MTKDEAIEKAKEAIVRAEETRGDDRQRELDVADRWITLAIHAFPVYPRELIDA